MILLYYTLKIQIKLPDKKLRYKLIVTSKMLLLFQEQWNWRGCRGQLEEVMGEGFVFFFPFAGLWYVW